MTKQNNGGFTLVELVISIAIGTLITGAALSSLLMGMRINGQTTNNIKQQNTTNMLVQVLQNIAEESDIIVSDDSTRISNPDNTISVAFIDHAVYLNNKVFMEDVTAFSAEMSEDNQLLTVSLTTNGKDYTATTYCRLNPTPAPAVEPDNTD